MTRLNITQIFGEDNAHPRIKGLIPKPWKSQGAWSRAPYTITWGWKDSGCYLKLAKNGDILQSLFFAGDQVELLSKIEALKQALSNPEFDRDGNLCYNEIKPAQTGQEENKQEEEFNLENIDLAKLHALFNPIQENNSEEEPSQILEEAEEEEILEEDEEEVVEAKEILKPALSELDNAVARDFAFEEFTLAEKSQFWDKTHNIINYKHLAETLGIEPALIQDYHVAYLKKVTLPKPAGSAPSTPSKLSEWASQQAAKVIVKVVEPKQVATKTMPKPAPKITPVNAQVFKDFDQALVHLQDVYEKLIDYVQSIEEDNLALVNQLKEANKKEEVK